MKDFLSLEDDGSNFNRAKFILNIMIANLY